MKPLILLAILTAACTPYADRVAATCERLGFAQGTPEYFPCVQQQMQIDAQDRAMWSGTTAVGAALLAQPQPVYVFTP